MPTQEKTVHDYLETVVRHKWQLIVPTFLFGILAFVFSLVIPNTYRSETLILVQRQQVPAEYVRPTVTSDLQDRLQTMTQEILSRTRLQHIIEKFGLFRQQAGPIEAVMLRGRHLLGRMGLQQFKKDEDMDDLVTKMRDNINIELIQRHGDSPGVTAFKVAYLAETPQLAQAVTTELTSLFIEENLKVREQMAESTSQFIDTEVDAARKDLANQELQLKDFKSKYMGELPEQQTTNLQLLGQLQSQLQTNADAINRLHQEQIYLKNIIAERETLLKGNVDGDAPATSDLSARLSKAKADLASLEARYTPQYPEVVKMREEVASLMAQLEKDPEPSTKPAKSPSKALLAADPSLTQAKSQLQANDSALKERLEDQDHIEAAIKDYQSRLRLAPVREQQFADLSRDYGNAKANYESLLNKKNLSDLASNLEKRQQGEQFRVLDPANLPMAPSKPNRPLITVVGLCAGLILSVAFVFGREMFDRSLQGEEDAASYLHLPVLGVIPSIDLTPEIKEPSSARSARKKLERASVGKG